jgi:hypothetical protein
VWPGRGGVGGGGGGVDGGVWYVRGLAEDRKEFCCRLRVGSC